MHLQSQSAYERGEVEMGQTLEGYRAVSLVYAVAKNNKHCLQQDAKGGLTIEVVL